MTARGFTLIEVTTAMVILAVMTVILVPLAGSLMDVNRAAETLDEMARIYTAVTGDRQKGTYGYIGDTGKFPVSLFDLVQEPASTPGWNGPYLTDARVQSGVLYDPYGTPYECYYFANATSAVADEFVILSAGPDRTSTNTGTANACANYSGGAIPANYGTSATDTDNVVYPRFTDNAGLLKYNHLGTLAIAIQNFDENTAVNALVPGCPHLYTITITSVARGTNDQFSMPYNPGANSVDLPEGLYKVAVTSQTSLSVLWEEQVAISPGTTTARTINFYTGLNSSQTPNRTFRPTNNMGVTIFVREFNSAIGSLANGATAPVSGSWLTLNPCATVISRLSAATGIATDVFTYPFLTAAYLKRINANALCTVTVFNQSVGSAVKQQVLVYEQGVFIGIVGSRGKLKSKDLFKVKLGNTVTVYDTTTPSPTLLNTTVTSLCPQTITIT
jgi:prepilin-type N-terminal cleavage/methylation domain-containing protein